MLTQHSLDSLLKRQAQEILILEERAKEQVLSTLRSAQSEIREVLSSKGNLNDHYLELQREIDGILARVDPKVPTEAFQVGSNQALETVSEETGLWIGSPKINVSALAAIDLDTQRRIAGVTDDLRKTVGDQLRISFALGEGIAEATERIASTGFRRSLWRYELIARTVTNELANQGHLSTYSALNEQVPGLKLRKKYLAFVDNRTTPICQSLNGEERDLEETFSNGVQRPPSHPNCRSRITAIAVRVPNKTEQEQSPVPVKKKTRTRKEKPPSKAPDKAPEFTLPQGYQVRSRNLKKIINQGDQVLKRLAGKLGVAEQKYRELESLSRQVMPHQYESFANRIKQKYADRPDKLNLQLERLKKRGEREIERQFQAKKQELIDVWKDTFVGANDDPFIDRLVAKIRLKNAFGEDTELVAENVERALRFAPKAATRQMVLNGLEVEPTTGVNRYSYEKRTVFLNLSEAKGYEKHRTVFHEINHSIDDALIREPTHTKLAVELSNGVVVREKINVRVDGKWEEIELDFFKTDKLGLDKYSHRAYLSAKGKPVNQEFFEVASEGLVDPSWFFETVRSADPTVIRYLLGSISIL